MDQIALLHRTYKFKKNAPLLKYFITKKSKQPAPTFTLPTILIEVLALFEEEKCYDTHNNNIIFCNSQLTKALNVLALHVSQIKKYVLKQLICTDQPKEYVNNTFLIKQPVFKNQTLLPIHYILSYSLRRVFKNSLLFLHIEWFFLTAKFAHLCLNTSYLTLIVSLMNAINLCASLKMIY